MKASKKPTKPARSDNAEAGGVASALTKQPRAEKARRDSRTLLESIFDTASDMIWSVDPETFGLLTFNRPVSDYFLQQRGIHLRKGMRPEDLFSNMEFVSQWRGFYERALSEGTFTSDYTVSAGSMILQLTLNLLQRDGKFFGISGFGTDVTERRRAGEELRRSQQELQDVLASIPDYLWSADIDSQGQVTYRYYSPVVEKITGRPPEFYMPGPQRWLDTVHPEDRPRILKAVETVSTAQRPQLTEEYRIILPNGTARWVRDHVLVRRQGGRTRLDGVVSDITERKKAEDALRQSEAELKEALLAAQMGVWEWAEATDTVTWDENLYRIAGRDPKLPAPTYREQRAIFVPESWERLKAAVENALATGTPYELDLELIRPDGSKRWLIGRGERRRDAHGHNTQLRGTVQDITERKLAEEELALLKRSIDVHYDGAYWTDHNDRFVYVNDAGCKALGYEREELIGMSVSDVNPMASPHRLKRLWESLRTQGFFSTESVHRRKDGSEFPVELVVSYVRFGGREFTCGFARDITERLRAEEALRQSEQRYRDFIAHSHEGVWRLELDQPIPIDLPAEESLERFLQGAYLAESNIQHARYLGFSAPEEILGKRFGEIVHPADRGRWESYRSAARKGWKSRTVEFLGLDKAGNRKSFLRTEIPIVENGMLVRVWGITRDITELRQAEGELRRSEGRWRGVFENSSVGIALTDGISMRFQAANLAFQKMVGYTEEELRAWMFMDITHEDDREPNRRLLAEVVEGKRESFAMEKRYRRKDGSLIWVNLHVSMVPGTESIPRFFLAVVEDITERKRAEEALRESEERFRATFENAGIGMAMVDMQGHPFKANPALRQMLGYSEEELSRLAFTVFTHPDDRELDWKLYRKLMAGEAEKYEIEKRYLKKDGGVVWGLLTATLVKSSSGLPVYCVGMVQDITQRKQTETALRESDERLRSLFENATVGIYRTTPEGRILMANPALVKMLGYQSLEDLSQRNLEDQGFEAEFPREHFHARMTREGEVKGSETVWKKQDGSPIFVRESARAIRGEGNQILYYDGFVENITERKKAQEALRISEERFRLFMNNSPTVAWMKDGLGHYVYVSETFEKRVGVRLEDQLGRTDFDIYPRVIADQFRMNDRAALEAGHPIEVIEESVDPDGRASYWLTYKFPLQDAAGEVFVAGIGSDITERRRMEKDLQDSLAQLRALAGRLQSVREEERKRVAREIHDQLGQVLTAIKIDLSSLVRELPAGQNQPLDKASGILKLVDESIHTVRRISTELRPGMLDDLGLVATIEWAGEDFQSRSGTVCRLDLPQEDMALDPDHATAIFRILQETLTNVARHAEAGKVEVRLAREEHGLTLEVHDDGKGIPEDRISANKSLGILGMRERAMLLGGELTISSLPGNGTTVRVRIPVMPRPK